METQELERFMISREASAEGTACCVQLACDPSVDHQTARWATLAFFRYGGAPSSGLNGATQTPLSAQIPTSPIAPTNGP